MQVDVIPELEIREGFEVYAYTKDKEAVFLVESFKLHVYGKRQTSDSSWEFLKIENEQIETAQNNSYR